MALFILLFILWLIWNGRLTLEIIVIGVLLAAGLVWLLHKFMGYPLSFRREWEMLGLVFPVIRYLWTLFVEIIKCNLNVSKMILNFQEEPEPVIVRFHTDVQSETGQVIVANSITLTPGTMTVDVDDGEYMVHCLDRTYAEDINQSTFVEQVKGMEQKTKGGSADV